VTPVIREKFRKKREKAKKLNELMVNLNKRKLEWIISEMKKGELSVYRIAKQQNICKWHTWRLYHRYLQEGVLPTPKPSGRPAIEATQEEIDLVKKIHQENAGAGAVVIEKILKEDGKHLPHNKIHRILLKEGLAREQPAKKNRRKWVRYERKHSLSLVHTDWFEYKRKQYILYEDDASRLITGYGEFRNATTENSIKVFDESVENWGLPKQVMSDHGTQFCANDDRVYLFTEHLKSKGVQHIKARVKHPQSNGKLERLVFTTKRLLDRGLDIHAAVKFYNEKRYHMSLENGHLRTPLQAFNDKMRKT